MQRQAATVLFIESILLGIQQIHLILFCQILISADAKSLPGVIPHPGAFCYRQVMKPMFFQIFYNSRNDLWMCNTSVLCRIGAQYIRFDPDAGILISDHCIESGLTKKPLRHRLIIFSVYHENFILRMILHPFCSVCTTKQRNYT